MAGIAQDSEAIWMSACVASVNFLCTFIGLCLVERIGRRLLMLVSMFGVVLSLAFLAIGFHVAAVNTPHVDIDEGSICDQFTNCHDCIAEKTCGFCFSSDNDGQ